MVWSHSDPWAGGKGRPVSWPETPDGDVDNGRALGPGIAGGMGHVFAAVRLGGPEPTQSTGSSLGDRHRIAKYQMALHHISDARLEN